MQYPIFIKYPNGKKFIKITNNEAWEEIVYFGSQKNVTQSKIQIFSDRVYLQDVLQYLQDGLLMEIEEEEYNLHL